MPKFIGVKCPFDRWDSSRQFRDFNYSTNNITHNLFGRYRWLVRILNKMQQVTDTGEESRNAGGT